MPPEPLATSPNCLLAFIDDSGNESFRGQPYFGLGGILISGAEHDALLKPRWRELRRFINGDPDLPLHASELGAARNMPHIEAAGAFFGNNHFLRFGAVTTNSANVPPQLTQRQPVYEMLKKWISEAAAASNVDSVALIFESSQRADPILQAEFGNCVAIRNGVELPVEHCLMPKAANDPGLEAADFVANAVGSMARRVIAGRRDFPADFCAVFHAPPGQCCKFIHITDVQPTELVSGFGL
ncbi:MAG TPA: DUF3800 domain-containing protein [Rhizomicrobium sp.]|nr:DUF3800 domain-containing protein [Rhizomicrobium sp.]